LTERKLERKTRVAVLGATGYSGAELCVLLARHPHAEIVSLFFSGKKDSRAVPFARLHPHVAAWEEKLRARPHSRHPRA